MRRFVACRLMRGFCLRSRLRLIHRSRILSQNPSLNLSRDQSLKDAAEPKTTAHLKASEAQFESYLLIFC
jgi:hypothetical protein